MKKNTILITLMVMISNIVVKILGLIRDVVLANTYGTSIYSDAYIVANNIPIVIFSVVAVAISTSFIPIFSEINELEGENQSIRFMNNFINIILLISVFIVIIGELFPDLLVKIFAYGFSDEAYRLTVNFTKILLPSIIIIALMSVAGSYLQLNKDFVPISYVSIPNNILVIISIILAFYTDKPYLLAIGTLVGMISQIIYYYPFVKRNGYKHIFYVDFKDKYLKRIMIMIIPVFIGAAVNEVNTIIDRALVSGLESGSIAALNYASKLIGFITGVFIVSIITIIYPKMSEMSAKLEFENFKSYIVKFLSIIILLIIPITMISIIYSKDIVKIIFERGTFDERSTYMTAISLSAYSIGLIGIAFREILTKAYFSLKDTKTPMINGAIAVIFNIILNIFLIRKIGFVGSAIATSITSLITSGLLIINLQKKIGKVLTFKFYFNASKIIISSIFSCIGWNYLYKNITILNKNMLMQLIVFGMIVILTILSYITILFVLKEDNIIDMWKIIKIKIKRK